MTETGKKRIWATTVDNPFDPFSQWDKWYEFDEKMEYHTCGRIARLCRPSHDLTEAEEEPFLLSAIDTLIQMYWPDEVYVLAVEGETRRFGA